MGIFDSLQNLVGGASDLAQGSLGDVAGGLTEGGLPDVSAVTDQVSAVTDGATEAATSAAEQGTTAVEDIKQNLGL